MPSHDLDRLVQVIRESLPPDDDQIAYSVEVVPLLMDELPDFVELRAVSGAWRVKAQQMIGVSNKTRPIMMVQGLMPWPSEVQS